MSAKALCFKFLFCRAKQSYLIPGDTLTMIHFSREFLTRPRGCLLFNLRRVYNTFAQLTKDDFPIQN